MNIIITHYFRPCTYEPLERTSLRATRRTLRSLG